MSELFICECGDPEHQFIVDKDQDFGVYIAILLNPEKSIFKRIWIAIKYIFGHKSIYGAFDYVIINDEDIDRLCEILKCGQTEVTPASENKWESEC